MDDDIQARYASLLQSMVEEALAADGTGVLDRAPQSALELMREAMGAQAAALLSHDPSTGELVSAAAVGVAGDLVVRELVTGSLVGSRARSGGGGTLSTSSQEGCAHLEVSEALRRRGIRTLCRVRLATCSEAVEALHLGLPDEDPRDAHTLDIMAERVAFCLDTARWCARFGEVLSVLHAQSDARSEMVSLLVHDLRGPLSTAKLAAQLLRYDAEAMESHRQLAAKIDANIDRTDRMIRDLLDANRAHGGRRLAVRLDRCDLSSVVASVAEELEKTYEQRFVVDAPGPTWGVWDEEQLHRVIWNLASIAARQGVSSTRVHIDVEADDGGVRVALHPIPVSLRGAEREHPTPRTELGLAMARGCAEAHGGRMYMRRDVRLGTIVVLELPLDARRPGGLVSGARPTEGDEAVP